MTTKVFGIALFGLGRAGTIHFNNLRVSHRAEVIYIVEADVDLAKQVTQKYRLTNVKVVPPNEIATVLQDPRVDAAVVATPTFTHQAIVTEAVRRGKPVFCEKPIAQDANGTRTCYEEAEKMGVPLMCSFNRRYDPSLREVKERAAAGEIGKLHVVKSTARDHPRPPNAYLAVSGGFFHDCAVHDLDMLCWVVGEFPSEVHAYAHVNDSAMKEMGDSDTAVMTLKFPSGVIGVIDISRHANYGYDQRLEVFGIGGMLQSENQLATSVISSNDRGTHTDKLKHSFPQRYAQSYVNAMDHFFDILEGKTELDVTSKTTLEVSRLASACEESAKTGKNIIMADFVEHRG